MVHPRAEWADIHPAFSPARRGVPDVFVHHEGGAVRGVPADKARVLREIEHGVLGKGYIAIDYNLMVFNDGDVWEGRGLGVEDAATIRNNPTSVSICAVGNYEREPATDALIAGIARAIAYASGTGWTVARPNIRPHRDVFATACPGAALYARMADIRRAATTGVVDAPKPPAQEDEMQRCYLLEDSRIRPGGHNKRIAVGNLLRAVLCDDPADVTRYSAYRFENAHDGDTPVELGKDGKPLRLKVDPADLDAALKG